MDWIVALIVDRKIFNLIVVHIAINIPFHEHFIHTSSYEHKSKGFKGMEEWGAVEAWENISANSTPATPIGL